MEPQAFPLAGLRKIQAGKMTRHRDNVDIRMCRLSDQIAGLGIVTWLENPFDAGRFAMVRKKALGDIGLLIEIHDQATPATLLADGGDEPAEMRFADTALQVERRNHAGAAVGWSGHGQDDTITASQKSKVCSPAYEKAPASKQGHVRISEIPGIIDGITVMGQQEIPCFGNHLPDGSMSAVDRAVRFAAGARHPSERRGQTGEIPI
jgi:hypothetical protein